MGEATHRGWHVSTKDSTTKLCVQEPTVLKTTIYDTGKCSKGSFGSPTGTHVSGYIYLLPKTSSGTDCSRGWPSSLVHINYTAPAVNCVALINGLLIAAACFFCCKVLKVKAWLVSRGRKQSHDQKSLLGWLAVPSFRPE